jgi:hypothetical protein
VSSATHPEFEEYERAAPDLARAAAEHDLHGIDIDIATASGKIHHYGWLVNGTHGTFAIYPKPCDHPYNRTEWIMMHRPTGMQLIRSPFTFTNDREHAFRMALAFHNWLKDRGADLDSAEGAHLEPFLTWVDQIEHDAFWRGIAAS